MLLGETIAHGFTLFTLICPVEVGMVILEETQIWNFSWDSESDHHARKMLLASMGASRFYNFSTYLYILSRHEYCPCIWSRWSVDSVNMMYFTGLCVSTVASSKTFVVDPLIITPSSYAARNILLVRFSICCPIVVQCVIYHLSAASVALYLPLFPHSPRKDIERVRWV